MRERRFQEPERADNQPQTALLVEEKSLKMQAGATRSRSPRDGGAPGPPRPSERLRGDTWRSPARRRSTTPAELSRQDQAPRETHMTSRDNRLVSTRPVLCSGGAPAGERGTPSKALPRRSAVDRPAVDATGVPSDDLHRAARPFVLDAPPPAPERIGGGITTQHVEQLLGGVEDDRPRGQRPTHDGAT